MSHKQVPGVPIYAGPNHLDQVHGMDMDMEERKEWLKWSKIGICVPQQSEEPKEFNMEELVWKIYLSGKKRWRETLTFI